MGNGIDQLARGIGADRLSRRRALTMLAGAGVSGASFGALPAFAEGPPALLGKVQMISHVGVLVSDLKKSAEFYQKLFGFPAIVPTATPLNSAGTYGFYFNGHFISLSPTTKDKAGHINHFCLAFKNLDPARGGAKLTAGGFQDVKVDTSTSHSGADRWVMTSDPDGAAVQLFDEKYTAPCPTCDPVPDGASMPPPAKSTFRARTISHVGIAVSDLKKSKAFYQTLTGVYGDLRPLAPVGDNTFAVDFNKQFLALAPTVKAKPGTITHFCIGVENFDAKRQGAELMAAGFAKVNVETERMNCITLLDPDNVLVQISDQNYIYPCPSCASSPA